MKKTIILLAALFIGGTSFAQINKGQYLVGGNAGFTSTSVSGGGGSVTDVSLSPNFGYFVMDKLAVGAKLDLSSQSGGGATVSTFSFGPYARYYFLDAAAKTNIFGQAGINFGSTNAGGGSTSSTGFQLAAGPAFFLTPNVALEIGAQFTSLSGGGATQSQFGVMAGFQIHMGNAK